MVDQLPVLLDQVTHLAFRLDEADVTQQLLAHFGRTRILTYGIDHFQNVQKDASIVAAGMAKQIESAVEQLGESDRLQNQAQTVILVVVIGVFLSMLDKQRQTFPKMIQAGHSRERVIDGGRHGSHRHFDELVDRVGDILGGCTPVSNPECFPDWLIQFLIHPSGGSNRDDPRLMPDQGTRLAQQSDDQVMFPSQGKQILRIDKLDVSHAYHSQRITVFLYKPLGSLSDGSSIAPDHIWDLGMDNTPQLCTCRGGDIRSLQHGADMLDQQDQRGKGCQHQEHSNRDSQLGIFWLYLDWRDGKGSRQAIDKCSHKHSPGRAGWCDRPGKLAAGASQTALLPSITAE